MLVIQHFRSQLIFGIRANFFLLFLSRCPFSSPSPALCTPHLAPPCHPTITLTPHSSSGLIPEWGLGTESTWYYVSESCTREEKRIWERDTVRKKEMGTENQKEKKTGRSKVEIFLSSLPCPPESCSRGFLLPDNPWALLRVPPRWSTIGFAFLIFLTPYSDPKDPSEERSLEKFSIKKTESPMAAWPWGSQWPSLRDFLISTLDRTGQILHSSWGWSERRHVQTPWKP